MEDLTNTTASFPIQNIVTHSSDYQIPTTVMFPLMRLHNTPFLHSLIQLPVTIHCSPLSAPNKSATDLDHSQPPTNASSCRSQLQHYTKTQVSPYQRGSNACCTIQHHGSANQMAVNNIRSNREVFSLPNVLHCVAMVSSVCGHRTPQTLLTPRHRYRRDLQMSRCPP